jgi:hypothetical protein
VNLGVRLVHACRVPNRRGPADGLGFATRPRSLPIAACRDPQVAVSKNDSAGSTACKPVRRPCAALPTDFSEHCDASTHRPINGVPPCRKVTTMQSRHTTAQEVTRWHCCVPFVPWWNSPCLNCKAGFGMAKRAQAPPVPDRDRANGFGPTTRGAGGSLAVVRNLAVRQTTARDWSVGRCRLSSTRYSVPAYPSLIPRRPVTSRSMANAPIPLRFLVMSNWRRDPRSFPAWSLLITAISTHCGAQDQFHGEAATGCLRQGFEPLTLPRMSQPAASSYEEV